MLRYEYRAFHCSGDTAGLAAVLSEEGARGFRLHTLSSGIDSSFVCLLERAVELHWSDVQNKWVTFEEHRREQIDRGAMEMHKSILRTHAAMEALGKEEEARRLARSNLQGAANLSKLADEIFGEGN